MCEICVCCSGVGGMRNACARVCVKGSQSLEKSVCECVRRRRETMPEPAKRSAVCSCVCFSGGKCV